jgi:hypothetical protein
VGAIDVGRADRSRVGHHLSDEGVERAILLGNSGIDAVQNVFNQILIAQ